MSDSVGTKCRSSVSACTMAEERRKTSHQRWPPMRTDSRKEETRAYREEESPRSRTTTARCGHLVRTHTIWPLTAGFSISSPPTEFLRQGTTENFIQLLHRCVVFEGIASSPPGDISLFSLVTAGANGSTRRSSSQKASSTCRFQNRSSQWREILRTDEVVR